jgi:hypothetical protein
MSQQTDSGTKPKKNRSGSENRKRHPRVYSRVSDAERQQIEQDAAAQGLTVGAYLRSLAITSNPQTRPVRRPLADVRMLAQIKGQVGRIGGNIHQLLKLANRGDIVNTGELAEAAKEAREFLAAATDALRRGEV